MAQFREAYMRLVPNHHLVNTHGRGILTFDVYQTHLPTLRTDALLKFLPLSASEPPERAEFAGWDVHRDTASVEVFTAQRGFAADGWDALRMLGGHVQHSGDA